MWRKASQRSSCFEFCDNKQGFSFFFSSFPFSGLMKQKLFRDLWNWSIQARMRMWVWEDLSFVFMDSGSRKVQKNLSVFPWMMPRCLIEGDNEGWSSWMDTPSLHCRVQSWHDFFYFWSGFDFNFTTCYSVHPSVTSVCLSIYSHQQLTWF